MSDCGRFITLEGGEGAGKSTLLKALSKALTERGRHVVETREPGGTKGAEAIRSLLLDPAIGSEWSAMSQLLLFNAARRDHLEKVILPAVERGSWVLCDRFSDSTRAYQSLEGASSETVEAVDSIAVSDHQPDLTLILDIDPSIASQRRQARNGAKDVFESKPSSFHVKVREAFLEIAEQHKERCVIIDASQSPENILSDALAHIIARLEA